MTFNGWIQIVLYCASVALFAKPLGAYMARVFEGGKTFLTPAMGGFERNLYRIAGVDAEREQHWLSYTISMLLFSVVSFVALYAMQRLQGSLPINPAGMGAIPADSAFNTAVSFVSNTNWQGYAGETTMSYLTQMAGLTVQNFVSAAVGIAIAIALVRGFARKSARSIGNFWVDLTRATLYVLLPLCVVIGLALVALGVPQNLNAYSEATTLDGAKQLIAQGPVASQLAIKQLGTNGGGFFNANSAHPFENPNALTNFIEMWAIFLIGAALTYTFGRMVGNQRQGWAIFATMGILFLAGVAIVYWAEANPNPFFAELGIDPSGGNMEGKEVRFGVALSALFTVITTAASCGAVNAMHDSLMPLGGMVAMINMQLGEVIVGGVGAGLYGILVFAIIAVFIAGLMVGRTPEYIGKKIEAKEVKMAMLTVLIIPLAVLGFTALAVVVEPGLAGMANKGMHGFSEVLYAFTSAAANNGSAFAGLSANTPFYNTLLGIAMLMGRFLMIVPILAIAGSLAAKRAVPASAGTFPTTGALFVALLGGVILITGGLTYFPALAFGPIVDHLSMIAGQTF